MTRLFLALILGLSIGVTLRSWTGARDMTLGVVAGMAALRLWTTRQQASEKERKAHLTGLVSLGWEHGKLGTTETTTLRIAIPPREL